jgi:hypothetical protein
MTTIADLLTEIQTPIQVCRYMDGCEVAAELDGAIHVSPALWDSIKQADEDELKTLCESVTVVRLGRFALFDETNTNDWLDKAIKLWGEEGKA